MGKNYVALVYTNNNCTYTVSMYKHFVHSQLNQTAKVINDNITIVNILRENEKKKK
jgi:hypothetical protein